VGAHDARPAHRRPRLVSDLYQETAEPVTGGADAGRGTADAGYQPESADGPSGYDGYQENSAEIQARIASQDELPTPEESRAATWGDDPQYDDEADLASGCDGDAGAFSSWEDDLPSPEESRAATWGDNPQHDDEADLASGYDVDAGAFRSWEDDLSTPEQARAATWGDNPQYDDEAGLASEYDGDLSSLTAGDADDLVGPEETSPAAAESGPAPPADAIVDPGASEEPGRDDDAGPSREDSGKSSSPEAEQLTALQAERDEARQENADLKGENAEKPPSSSGRQQSSSSCSPVPTAIKAEK
jgi:hypothetical protein